MTDTPDSDAIQVDYDPAVTAWLDRILNGPNRNATWLISALYRIGSEENSTDALMDAGLVSPEGDVVTAFWEKGAELEAALLEHVFDGDQEALDTALRVDILDQVDLAADRADEWPVFPPWKNHWT